MRFQKYNLKWERRNLSCSLFLVFFLGQSLCVLASKDSPQISTDVLVVGGTASGTTAAIQAARNGAHVVLVEAGPWLGGMLTSAGVSATDGNHLMPSGLWGEFRSHLYDYYGGPQAVATGWVSNTQFEPHIGNEIFSSMVNQESRIIRIHGYHLIKSLVNNSRITGAVFINETATDTLVVNAKISIDATEAGDLMALSGCGYFIGQDPKSATGEAGAPDKGTRIIQDLTYVAILKDYGSGADKTIPQPSNYNPGLYECTCIELCNKDNASKYTACDKMLTYGKLPNGKYMINWPENGNDYYLDDLEMDYFARKKAYQKAKDHTLGWVYFIQTRGGYKNLGLAADEFPTEDKLALYPYYRESRRLEGMVQLRNEDLVDPYKNPSRKLYRTSVSVGDYPLDLHHDKMPQEIEYKIEPVPSFSVPYECMVPQKVDGLIVAEKSISVTHIVNGCTRLQPSVMLIGQAAGAAAALCVKKNSEPRNINIRELQQNLMEAKCWLMPYVDVPPQDNAFMQIQRVALCGIMRGEGIIEGWANKTYFYPDQKVTKQELEHIRRVLSGEELAPLDFISIRKENKFATRQQALNVFYKVLISKLPALAEYPDDALDYLNAKLEPSFQVKKEDLNKNISRKEIAVWIDSLFNPFGKRCPLSSGNK